MRGWRWGAITQSFLPSQFPRSQPPRSDHFATTSSLQQGACDHLSVGLCKSLVVVTTFWEPQFVHPDGHHFSITFRALFCFAITFRTLFEHFSTTLSRGRALVLTLRPLFFSNAYKNWSQQPLFDHSVLRHAVATTFATTSKTYVIAATILATNFQALFKHVVTTSCTVVCLTTIFEHFSITLRPHCWRPRSP